MVLKLMQPPSGLDWRRCLALCIVESFVESLRLLTGQKTKHLCNYFLGPSAHALGFFWTVLFYFVLLWLHSRIIFSS